MTNREWLESLSDEELAKMIVCHDYDRDSYDCPYDCINCKLAWLQAEHKDANKQSK